MTEERDEAARLIQTVFVRIIQFMAIAGGAVLAPWHGWPSILIGIGIAWLIGKAI